MIRVVLDTNVLVSALLCEKGRLAWIRHCWQNGRITPVMAEPTVNDQIFLDLAIGAGVQALVSGDRDLLDLADIISVPKILEPEVFRQWLEQPSSPGAAQSGEDPPMS